MLVIFIVIVVFIVLLKLLHLLFCEGLYRERREGWEEKEREGGGGGEERIRDGWNVRG